MRGSSSGIIAGWLTGKIMKGDGYGVIMDMVIGLVGALIGGWVTSLVGFGTASDHGLIISIVIATLGAIILTFLIRLVTGRT